MPRFRVGDRETVTHALALIESIGVEARNEVFLLYAIFYSVDLITKRLSSNPTG